MKKPITVVIGFVFFAHVPAKCVAQQSGLPEVPLHWVAFTATQHESSSWVNGVQAVGSQYFDLEFTGIFARDDSGAEYERWTHSQSPQTQFADVAYLVDRAHRTEWEIDYNYKNFHRKNLEVAAHPELSAAPMTWESFLKFRARDLSLGRKTLDGVDCVAYRIRANNAQKRFWKEIWFAPSLNFLPVRERYLSSDGKAVVVAMEKIRLGPPDPNLFHIPNGFTLLH